MSTEPVSNESKGREHFHWGFLSATGAILLLLVVGQAVGLQMAAWPPLEPVARLLVGDRAGAGERLASLLGRMGLRDWAFGAFLVSATVFAWLQRGAIYRFFRSTWAAVSLVIVTALAVGVGVLVPQMDGFEDPETRITEGNYEQQYRAFRWAEGYFLYHISHLYGRGLPESELPAGMLAELERVGARYGREERENLAKRMRASFAGQQKTEEIRAFVDRHDPALRTFFDVATALELNRAYKSSWFATLMGLIGLGVFFNTFKGVRSKWFSIHKAGFFVSHLGVLTLLAGGLVSNIYTERGILNLDTREPPKDVFLRYYDPAQEARMPFAVRLDRFGRLDWKQVQVFFEGGDQHWKVPSYTLWKGRRIDLDFREDAEGKRRPHLRLEVLEVHDRARADVPTITEGWDPARPDELDPVAELLVPPPPLPAGAADEAAREERRLHLRTSGGEALRIDPELRYRLKVAFAPEEPAAEFPGREGVLGTLELAVRGQESAEPLRVTAVLDEEIALPLGWRARVARATANYRRDPDSREEIVDSRPLAEQPPRFPAIWLEIFPPGEAGEGLPERRLLLDGIDWVEQGVQDRFAFSEVTARFDWNPWSAPGPPRHLLYWDREGPARLLSEEGTPREVAAGEALPLGDGGDTRLLQTVRNAAFSPTLVFPPAQETSGGFDADFYAQGPRGVVLEVIRDPDTPAQRSETVRLASARLHDLWRADDGSFSILFRENREMMPFEWRSVLSIIEKDGSGEPYVVPLGGENLREIRVNDYFKYGNYRFFQTNAIAEMPTYSGIGVVYDPGIPIVLVGMYTIIFGTAIAFIIRPIVLRRRQRRAEA